MLHHSRLEGQPVMLKRIHQGRLPEDISLAILVIFELTVFTCPTVLFCLVGVPTALILNLLLYVVLVPLFPITIGHVFIFISMSIYILYTLLRDVEVHLCPSLQCSLTPSPGLNLDMPGVALVTYTCSTWSGGG